MKKNNKGKAKSKTNANTLLNAVGGAVKLKWKYDKNSKQWWIGESIPWANDCMFITKEMDEYLLETGMPTKIKIRLKKLASAKIIAQLIKNG